MKQHPKKAHEGKENESKKESKEDNTMKYVIGVVVAILIIVLLVMFFRSNTSSKDTTSVLPDAKTVDSQKTAKDSTETVFPKQKTAVTQQTEPNLINYCDRTKFYALGFKPCSCALQDSLLKIQLRNSGKADISKVWFYVTSKEDKSAYLAVEKTLKPQETEEFAVDLKAVKESLGGDVQNVVALPGFTEGGKENVCLNQRLLVIKETNCVSTCVAS